MPSPLLRLGGEPTPGATDGPTTGSRAAYAVHRALGRYQGRGLPLADCPLADIAAVLPFRNQELIDKKGWF